jgi:hypothetical protein
LGDEAALKRSQAELREGSSPRPTSSSEWLAEDAAVKDGAVVVTASSIISQQVDVAFLASGGQDAPQWSQLITPVTSGAPPQQAEGKKKGGKKGKKGGQSTALPQVGHSFDLNRAETRLEERWGAGDQLRDWNEEFQSCRELPRGTLEERAFRARALYRVHSEFQVAARLGAVAISENHIMAMNPMDPPETRVYSYNNIFFSYAVDSRGFFAEVGGEAAAKAVARLDLNAVKTLAQLDIPKLHTLLTAVLDYKGRRMVCQSIIPGILQGEKASKVVYGSVDNGETVACEPQMHALMKQAAGPLLLAETPVQPLGKGKAKNGEDLLAARPLMGGAAEGGK